MRHYKIHTRLIVAFFAVGASIASTSSAYADAVYHGVFARDGVIEWDHSSFGISGNPATLSFLHFDSDADATAWAEVEGRHCIIKVDIDDTDTNQIYQIAPQPAGLYIQHQIADAKPFPWNLVFDGVVNGNGDLREHWVLAANQISNNNIGHNAAGDLAGRAFQWLTQNLASVEIIDGAMDGC
jgi:hypothetical protein